MSTAFIALTHIVLTGKVNSEKYDILSELDSQKLLKIAQKNVIVCRLFGILSSQSPSLVSDWANVVEAETKRIEATTQLIGRIQDCCVHNSTIAVFTKSFQHFPDMGHDIDLFVESTQFRIDLAIIQTFNAIPGKNSLLNRISGKRAYDIHGADTPIEIHHGRLGQLGEHRAFGRLLAQRAVLKPFLGITAPVPCAEDHLVLQAVQRVYGHFTLRISDVVASIKLIESPTFNWILCLKTARHIGCMAGLTAYLSAIAEIASILAYSLPKIPIQLSTKVLTESPHSTCVSFKKSVILLAYASKFVGDLCHGRIKSVFKLMLLPFIASWIVLRNKLR